MKPKCIRSRCWRIEYPTGPLPPLPATVLLATKLQPTHTVAYLRFEYAQTKSVFGATLMDINAIPVSLSHIYRELLRLQVGVDIRVGMDTLPCDK